MEGGGSMIADWWWITVFLVSFRTGAAKYKNLEDSVFVASETVRSLGGGAFRAGAHISKVFCTPTNITIE